MNRYDTITIFDADTAEDDRKEILGKVEALITSRNGTLLIFDNWGGRKLAYPINKKKQGFYVRIDYCGDGALIDAIEQMLRHDLRILRFMTVRTEIDVDPEALKSEMFKEPEETAETPPAETAEEAAAETQPAESTEETASESEEE